MAEVVTPDGRTATALALVGAALLVGYVLVPDPMVQYGAWLFVFCVWMGWFVLTSVAWLRDS